MIATGGVNGTPRRNGAPAGHDRKRLPHNLDAEASILGGVILQNAVLRELPDLEVDDFYDLRHRVVFAAIRQLEHQATPIDVVTLEVEIERQGKLDAIGGIPFLGELVLRVPTASNVVAYADTVRLLARNRRAVLSLASALERATSGAYDADEILSETAGELQRLEEDRRSIVAVASDPLLRRISAVFGRQEAGDDDSDEWIIRDLIPRGEPAIWGGAFKTGKTWSAIDLCLALALGEDWLGFQNTLGRPARVLAILLEDSTRRTGKRFGELARARGRDFLADPVLDEHLRVAREVFRLPGDERRLAKRLRAFQPDVVVIDNLTRVMVGDPNSTRDSAAFTRAWTSLGEETGASIVLLHHTRKPHGDVKLIDPFDMLKGNTDFGAAARNIIVTLPLKLENELAAEVRMRGNLDLRRDSFVLGFERWQLDGQWRARLVDRGDVTDVRGRMEHQVSDAKKARRQAEHAIETEKRRRVALELVRRHGSVSTRSLGAALNLTARAGAVLSTLDGLVSSDVLRHDKRLGYVLADSDPDPQRDLDLEHPGAP